MDNSKFLEQLECTGIVPVIKLDNTDDAVNLAKALYEGGIRCAEVTFRAAGADKVIGDMVKAYPDMLVGAGTVLTVEQCDAAIDAGAKFCVAPGLNPKVVKHCLDRGVPFAPGVANGSQVEQALELGLNFVKFFPAEQAGGLPYIKSIAAPYGMMKFMPTGGVNEKNLNSYLAFNKIVCCGGSWIVPDNLVKGQKWAEITALCKTAVQKMLDFQLVHVGINAKDEGEASAITGLFSSIFGWEQKVGNSAIFSGSYVECKKAEQIGTHGHIAVSTPNVRRAVFQLEQQGVKFDYSTFTEKDGRITLAYLQDEIGGFKVHLVEKK